MDVTQQSGKRVNWTVVIFWFVVVPVIVIAFWGAIGWGVTRAIGAVVDDSPPTCTYSGVDMHQHYGTSSAACSYP